MYIVVYKEGNQHSDALVKETWAQANALETAKYIFAWDGAEEGYELYNTPGVRHYGLDGNFTPFKHDNYSLTDIRKGIHANVHHWQKEFNFIFRHDNNRDIVIKEISSEIDFPRALSNAIKEIILASKFSSWEEYQQNKLDIKETDRLKNENQALRKEVEELKQKLSAHNTTA